MKRALITAVFILMVCSTAVLGKKLATLEEPLAPYYMAVDDDQFYLVEKAKIMIFSLKDYSLKGTFGKSGEGPREFRLSRGNEGIRIYSQGKKLNINSLGKVSFFTKDGKFINELRTPSAQAPPMFQEAGKNIAGIMMAFENQTMFFTMNIFDGQFKKIKELNRITLMKSLKFEFPVPAPVCYVEGDKIIVPGKLDQFSIDIYHSDGTKAASIFREYPTRKVSDEYKKRIYDMFKQMPDTKPVYQQMKKMIAFGDRFIPIQFFWAADNMIYIQTFLEEEGKSEIFIYDINGKFIKRLFLPILYAYGARPYPIAFKHNKLYQVIENEEEEEWELHATEIK
ncbi:MAG: hypothetical protein GY940_17190 [bacterium]|nr:hypothetical protein [bacterium]